MRARQLFILVPVLLALSGTVAVAFWTAAGSTNASASVGTLNAPKDASASAVPGSSTVHITWTVSTAASGLEPTGYYILRHASGGGTSAACGSSPGSPIDETTCSDRGVADGSYTYSVVAKYASWTAASTPSSAVAVASDNTAPVLTLTSPADGSATNSTTSTLSGAAGNATGDSSIVTVRIHDDTARGGTDQQTLKVTRSGATWSTSATLAQGTYTVQATQTDTTGNTATSSANTFTVDTSAPAVTLASPTDHSRTNSTTPTLSGAAGNATGDSSIVTVRIHDDTARGGTDHQTLKVTRSGATWSTSVTLAQGTYTAQATQTDAAGNVATSTTNTFTVDTTAPTLTALQMFDVNADGEIDQVKATFSEDLAHSTEIAPWTLAGIPSDARLRSVSTSGAVATLVLTPRTGAADTAAGSFTVALAVNASDIRDAAGNQASFTATAPADLAAPVLMTVSANSVVNGGAGLMQDKDTFVMTFSEALAAGSVPNSVTVTESRSANISTLTIPGLINSALISDDYFFQKASGSGSSSSTVVLSDTTVTVTVSSVTEIPGGLTKGTGPAQIVPAPTLTDRAGNAAAATSQSTVLRLF